MKRIARVLLAAGVLAAPLALALASPAAAQSDRLLRLQSGSPAVDRMVVDTAGGMASTGTYGLSICAPIPATGAGARIMFYPCKAAFRAGYVPGSQWDNGSVGDYSWAGGDQTTASGMGSFAFGQQTTVTGSLSTGFGSGVSVTGVGGFAAGVSNRCSAFACVALGFTANAGGQGSVAMGYRATATTDYSVSIGYRVTNVTSAGNPQTGSVLIGATDLASSDSMRAQYDGEFRVRAPGGVRLRTSNAANSDAGSSGNTGCDLAAGSGSWACSSSRAIKENFAAVDGEEVLARLRSLPVTTWNYIAEGREVRHMGPVAEDFHAAFGLGVSDKSVGLQDIDGVNLAAVKALETRTAELLRALEELKEKTERLRAVEGEVAELRARLERLERGRR